MGAILALTLWLQLAPLPAIPPAPDAGAGPAAGLLTPRAFLPYVPRDHALVVPVTIEPAGASLVVGREQRLDVRVRDVIGLHALDITIAYDPALLLVVDEDPGRPNVQIGPGDWPPPGGGAAWPVAFNDTGRVYIPMFTFGAALDGTAVVARFRVRPRQAGSARLAVTHVHLQHADGSPWQVARGEGATLTVAAPPSPPSAEHCQPLPGETYRRLTIEGAPSNLPADRQPDINLGLRGAEVSEATNSLVDHDGETDPRAPQIAGLTDRLAASMEPLRFSSVFRLQDWDWSTSRPGGVIVDWPVTLAGIATTPGEPLRVPDSGYHIGDGHEVLVLYAAPGRVTLKYTREDNVVYGYTVHVEGVCVEPRLQALYDQSARDGRRRLPALRGGQAFGRAVGDELRFAIRDTGRFMDPRSRKDWWVGRP